ncbi:MAG: protein YgfX [Pseudomonadota bacterium]
MFSLPLVVTVGDSRVLRGAVGALHALAIVAVWQAELPVGVQEGGTLALLISCWLYSRPRPPVTLRCHKDGRVEMRSGSEWLALATTSAPMVLPWLAVLHFTHLGQHTCLAIAADTLSTDDFRRLRTWLRWVPHMRLA